MSVRDDATDGESRREASEGSRASAIDEAALDELVQSGALPAIARNAIEDARHRAKEAEDKMLRAVAETENQRKRLAKDQADKIRFANEKIIVEMLGVYDSLELCLSHAGDHASAKALREGVELTLTQFKQALENAGVEPFEPLRGTTFDPKVHEAVMQDDAADLPERAVVKTLQTGFMYRDRVLRAAKVVVATGRGLS
jgi:molecular chaperone GrpE